eukprot:TRINITY_DN1968_c0_g3_i1.p2 TRINITY_DN1968_c0_g3~~TRINITY_DN1968_c0_g3_i1.p2  ORF type:complete len:128 (-),score=4.13 TRINITY_DN1968_c0_g3_i1:742-1125(-)
MGTPRSGPLKPLIANHSHVCSRPSQKKLLSNRQFDPMALLPPRRHRRHILPRDPRQTTRRHFHPRGERRYSHQAFTGLLGSLPTPPPGRTRPHYCFLFRGQPALAATRLRPPHASISGRLCSRSIFP